jgi:hypothetical protein
VAGGLPEMALQIPTDPASLQDSHCPSQALSQQTPSAQCPVATQSRSLAQVGAPEEIDASDVELPASLPPDTSVPVLEPPAPPALVSERPPASPPPPAPPVDDGFAEPPLRGFDPCCERSWQVP